jgi:hypothetical protein
MPVSVRGHNQEGDVSNRRKIRRRREASEPAERDQTAVVREKRGRWVPGRGWVRVTQNRER